MNGILEKDIRLLKIYVVCSTMAFATIIFTGFQPAEKRGKFDEIDVQRINIVDERGRKFVVISNKERFPLPVVKGKEYPRSINPSGIVLYDENGNECGGMAVATLPTARRSAVILDYSNTEAVGFSVYETNAGKYGAGISIQDRNPLDADIMKVGTEGVNRISIENDNRNAVFSLSDPQGNKRIRLSVDSTGNASMQFLNEKGEVIFRLPGD